MLLSGRSHLRIMLWLLIGAGLLMGGCSGNASSPRPVPSSAQSVPSAAQQASPGDGTTMADQLYKVLRPVPGELISVPNPDNAETDKHQYLMDRFQAAKESHPALFVGILYPEPRSGWTYTFKDGSTMVWVADSSGGGINGTLDRVVITRP